MCNRIRTQRDLYLKQNGFLWLIMTLMAVISQRKVKLCSMTTSNGHCLCYQHMSSSGRENLLTVVLLPLTNITTAPQLTVLSVDNSLCMIISILQCDSYSLHFLCNVNIVKVRLHRYE